MGDILISIYSQLNNLSFITLKFHEAMLLSSKYSNNYNLKDERTGEIGDQVIIVFLSQPGKVPEAKTENSD